MSISTVPRFPRAGKALHPAPAGWLSRNEVCDMLNVSGNTLERWAKAGLLHPMIARSHRSNRPAWFYDPQELKNVPRRGLAHDRSPGELAARAFEMLDGGCKLRDVVIELRCDPRAVEDLYQQWLDMEGDSLAVSINGRKRLEAMVGGKFEDEDDLIEKLEAKLKGIGVAA